ncbi:hypothetical protein [Micromonospora sp. NPDC003776]
MIITFPKGPADAWYRHPAPASSNGNTRSMTVRSRWALTKAFIVILSPR